MPFIHIRSLPLVRSIEVPQVLKGIAEDVSREMEIDLRHIHTTWEYYAAEHYARGIATYEQQPLSEHPILVALLTPDTHSDESVQRMLHTIASSIAEGAQFPLSNIFIHHQEARSGRVFDEGDIVTW